MTFEWNYNADGTDPLVKTGSEEQGRIPHLNTLFRYSFWDGRLGHLAVRNLNDMKLLNASFPRRTWPTAKDQLFKEDSDWQRNAHLNLGGKDSGAYVRI